MENIIAQQMVTMQEKILAKLQKDGLENIGETAEALLQTLQEGTCALLQAILEATDAAIAKATKERKKDGLRVKERNVPRRLVTSLGEIEYRRTYYESADGERIYLLDHLIGVEAYERVSKALCAKLVNLASEMSYGRTVKHGKADISRQTVNNKVNALREVVQEVKREEHTPEELHIFADEDHVHLKDGRNVIVPLATVTEGIDASDPKRHKLRDPLHIAGYGMEAEAFADQVEACVNQRYDINAVRRIYIHGDGADRIVKLGERFPHAKHVLDGFHLEKALKTLGHYSGARERMGALRAALREGNWSSYKRQLKQIYAQQSEKDKERSQPIIRYLWNNRRAAQMRYAPGMCGSCTEALVSHVLAERLSRTPLAWSEHGLKKMSMLVVYCKNGQQVKAKDIRVSLKAEEQASEEISLRKGWSKYNDYMDRQMDLILNTDWANAFQRQALIFGKVDAAYLIRRSFGAPRPVA